MSKELFGACSGSRAHICQEAGSMLMKQEKHAQGLTQLAAGQVVLAQHNGGGVPKTFARA